MKSTLLAAVLYAVTVCSVPALAQTDTTFTYQGALNEAGTPANGSFNLEYSLFDALIGGSQVGSTDIILAQTVSDGVFSAQLDFGARDFSGAQYWLEVVVDGTTLSPRQALTASPYSIQTRGIFVDENNNVGIGTNSPITPFHVENSGLLGPGVFSHVTATDGLTVGGWFQNDSEVGTGVFGNATATTGRNYGVYGVSNGTSGRGVFGEATATTGNTYGGRFESRSTSGRGVYALAFAATGTTYGGRFENDSTSGHGVSGFASASTGTTYGGRFESDSTSGRAIYGEALATTGTTYGVVGVTNSPDGFAGYFTGGKSYFEGSVGVGFDDPSDKLHVFSGIGESAFRVQQAGQTRLRVNANGGVSLGGNSTVVGAGDVYVVGRLGIGDSTPEVQLDVVGDAAVSDDLTVNNDLIVTSLATIGGPEAFTFGLNVYGSAGKPGGGTWSVFSDQRLKKNITSMTGSLDTISALRPVNFEYKSEDHFSYLGGVQRGFIAQEVQKVIPQWVNTADDGYFYLDQVGYEALIVDAIQELRAEKDAVQGEVNGLRLENELLKARLDRLERMMALSIDR